MKVDFHFVVVDHVVEEQVGEQDDGDGTRVQKKDELDGGDHVGDGQQDDGRQSENDVQEFVEELVVAGRVGIDTGLVL